MLIINVLVFLKTIETQDLSLFFQFYH